MEVSVSGLAAEALVYQPNTVEVALTGPLSVRRENSPEITLDWTAMNVTLRALTADRGRAAVTVIEPRLASPDGVSRADRLDIRVGPTGGRPMEENAYDVWLTVEGGLVPALNTLTRDQEPVAVEEKGVLTHVDPTRLTSWQDMAENWREAGGHFEISVLRIDKGRLHVDARGNLGLDDQHRPAGRLDAGLAGYETLATQLGVPLPAVSVGGVLAELLTRGKSAPPSNGRAVGSLNLPVVLVDGRLMLGPFKTGWRLAPLY